MQLLTIKNDGLLKRTRIFGVEKDRPAAKLAINIGLFRRRRDGDGVFCNFVEIDDHARCHNLHSSVEWAEVVEIRTVTRMITFATHE